MKKLTILACFLSVFVLLNGCQPDIQKPASEQEDIRQGTIVLSSPTPPDPTSAVTKVPSGAFEQTSQITPTPTGRDELAMATKTSTVVKPEIATITSTPTIFTEAGSRVQCVNHVSFPTGSESTGWVVLEGRVVVDDRHVPEAYLLDMATGKSTKIADADNRKDNFIVSPDNMMLAYYHSILDDNGNIATRELVVESVDGTRLQVITEESGWGRIVGWLDDKGLVINIAELDSSENAAQKAATLLLINPFTGSRQILTPDFPELYDAPPIPDWEGWSIAKYDPTLTRVVYHMLHEEQFYYVLWDSQTNQTLAKLDIIGFPIPRWSFDGSHFIVTAYIESQEAIELVLVSRDGQIEQLTNLTTYDPKIYIPNYSWSPDGRFIALWLTKDFPFGEKEKAQLAILDLVTGEVVNYCVTVTYGGDRYGYAYPPAPLWSPDGKQLLLVDWYEKDHRHVLLVDVIEGYATVIAEDMLPVGWMVTP